MRADVVTPATTTITSRVHPSAGWTDGKKRLTCRQCEGMVPKGRRSFCSGRRAQIDRAGNVRSPGEGCVHDWLVRTQPSYARLVVGARDRGVCAGCGADTCALAANVWALRDWPDVAVGALAALGYAPGDVVVWPVAGGPGARVLEVPSLWQADHIVPVVEGGGGCGLDNLRTLCKPCHRRETAALAKRRAAARLAKPAPPGTPLLDAVLQHVYDKPVVRGDVAIPPEAPDLTCEPAFKYVGGKRQLLVQRPDVFPARETVRRYHEPFAGGLAVFFGRYAGVPAVLNDSNRWLMMAYRMLRERPDDLIAALRELVDAYNEWSAEEHEAAGGFYLLQRERFHAPRMDPAKRSAIFLFLLRSNFNGLYRVNADGRYNVSWGKRKKLKLGEEKLRAASRALQTATLINHDFEAHLFDHVSPGGRGRFAVGPGDFVFFDSPYAPASKTASFAAYQAGGDWRANGKDTLRLVEALRQLRRLYGDSVRWTLSNADTPETRELYREWHVESVMMPRSVNRDGTKRGGVSELLVTNGWNR